MDDLTFLLNYAMSWLAASAITIIVSIVVGVAGYVYSSYILMCMGQKAGNPENKNWMAYIPFARDIYYLNMAKRPWWQMFFFRSTGVTVAGLLFLLVSIISSNAYIAATVIMVIYALGVTVFTLFVKAEVYFGFGFNKWIVLSSFGWLETLIAFSCRISFDSNGNTKNGKARNGALIGISGVYAGQVFELSRDSAIIIGRDPSQCELVFPENRENISRHHCDIRYYKDRNAYGVTDYSKNGTFINGEKIPSNMERMCGSGSVISLGGQSDSFRLQ